MNRVPEKSSNLFPEDEGCKSNQDGNAFRIRHRRTDYLWTGHSRGSSAARRLGKRALVVRGSDPARTKPLLTVLEAANMEYSCFEIRGEPTVEQIADGVNRARQAESDLVIGFGGGSVIDSAKAIAGLVTNPGEILDYLEIIGKGKQLAVPALPCIAIPTTAGTGAEVTRNSVLASPEHRVKVSLRSPFLLPRLAIIDPKLTCDLPAP